MSKTQAVIFDVDGTLVDSNDAHAHAWVEALTAFGHSITFAQVRPLIGMGGDKILPRLAGVHKDSEQGRAIDARRSDVFVRTYLPNLHPFPGTRDLLLALYERSLKLVVASSSKEDELKPLLALTGAPQLFEARTSSQDAPESKPDPDVVHAALDRAGVPPAHVTMVGDTPYDLEAAQRAGVRFIGVRCGGWDGAALAGADGVYDDPADLLAHLDRSPLVDAAGAR
ncbi:MAG TPA: HAD family hydrolase [Dehalococcoidia bacterium]|jgi:HAD superfamily hydrolase (TIGR01509 family)